MHTLYQLADIEIRSCIKDYLSLANSTNGFTAITEDAIDTDRKAVIVLSGINAPLQDISPKAVVCEWQRRKAIPFDAEAAITAGVYSNLRDAGVRYLEEIKTETNSFSVWSPEVISANPHALPLLQHLAGIFSKSALRKHVVGTVSDKKISKPAAKQLADMLHQRVQPSQVKDGEILKRLETTLEGIVRDLIGRVMLESIVEHALSNAKVSFKREKEYTNISGVVYDFRADFVIPDEKNPLAFIEVRKSSSRHASLYAKDKMFSAINWKGKHKGLLAILVVDGEWTTETLRVMAKVFDYVVPLSHVNDLAITVAEYLNGDKSKLKWLIDFSITATTYPNYS
jgi:hypothetical protein